MEKAVKTDDKDKKEPSVQEINSAVKLIECLYNDGLITKAVMDAIRKERYRNLTPLK